MKTRLIFCLSLLLLNCGAVLAQSPDGPSPTLLTGYWNVETNLTTRDYTIVRFYNGQDQLVYEERLDDFCLNLRRKCPSARRAHKQLNVALQQLLQQPENSRNTALLAQQFKADKRYLRVYAVR